MRTIIIDSPVERRIGFMLMVRYHVLLQMLSSPSNRVSQYTQGVYIPRQLLPGFVLAYMGRSEVTGAKRQS